MGSLTNHSSRRTKTNHCTSDWTLFSLYWIPPKYIHLILQPDIGSTNYLYSPQNQEHFGPTSQSVELGDLRPFRLVRISTRLGCDFGFQGRRYSHTSFHGPSNRIQVNTFGYTWIHLNTVRPWKTLEFSWSRNQLNTIGHLDTTEYIRIHLDTFRHLDRFEDV